MDRRSAVLLALLGLAALSCPHAALAASTNCPAHYAGGLAPDFQRIAEAGSVHELCFQAFGVVHAGAARTPLWSAEHVTKDNTLAARSLPRDPAFHAEERLARAERSELSDYDRNGFDSGQMAPFLDMPNAAAQVESFSLANVVPENPRLTRGLWNELALAVRNLAETDGELYVVTGPVFQGAAVPMLARRVLIPTHLYKAVYDPRQQAAAAYLVVNGEYTSCKIASLAELSLFAEIDAFPGIPEAARTRLLALPSPLGPAGPRCQ